MEHVSRLKPKFRVFEFKDTLKTDAYKETFLLDENGKRIPPFHEEYSKTHAHGEHYYTEDQVKKAIAILTIDISNSGRHYCSVQIDKDRFNKLPPERKARLLKRILEIHECPRIYEDLADYL